MRTRPFTCEVRVASEWLATDPAQAEHDALAEIVRSLSVPQLGPRGGRYVPMKEPLRVDLERHDPIAGHTIYVGHMRYRYVRPRSPVAPGDTKHH